MDRSTHPLYDPSKLTDEEIAEKIRKASAMKMYAIDNGLDGLVKSTDDVLESLHDEYQLRRDTEQVNLEDKYGKDKAREIKESNTINIGTIKGEK